MAKWLINHLKDVTTCCFSPFYLTELFPLIYITKDIDLQVLYNFSRKIIYIYYN